MLDEPIEFNSNIPVNLYCASIEEYPMHTHTALEILYVLEGEIELYYVNADFILSEGDVYICNPKDIHSIHKLNRANVVLSLHIDLSFFEEAYHDINSFLFTTNALGKDAAEMNTLKSIITDLAMEIWQIKDNGRIINIARNIIEALIENFQFYYLEDFIPTSNNIFKNNAIQKSRLQRITDYIYQNYNKQIRIEDIANLENISTYHLTSILRSGSGHGFRQLVNTIRAERSALLLLGDNMPLHSISYECGFSKYEYFKEHFTRFFGMTPNEYRKMYQDEIIGKKQIKMRVLDDASGLGKIMNIISTVETIKLDFAEEYNTTKLDPSFYAVLMKKNAEISDCVKNIKRCQNEIKLQIIKIEAPLIEKSKNNWETLYSFFNELHELGIKIDLILDSGSPESFLKTLFSFLKYYKKNARIDPGRFFITCVIRTENDASYADLIKNEALKYGIDTLFEKQNTKMVKVRQRTEFLPCLMFYHFLSGNKMLFDDITLLDESLDVIGSFERGSGLLTHNSLKKPLYFLYYMLARLGDDILIRGNGYILTRSADCEEFQIMVCHYSHEKTVSKSNNMTLDINNIFGRYAVKKYRLSFDDSISLLDKKIFVSENLSEEIKDLINKISAPKVSLATVKARGRYVLHFNIAPYEIILISFEKL